MINSNNENQDKLKKVTYQTHGTCSKYICISVDELRNPGDFSKVSASIGLKYLPFT